MSLCTKHFFCNLEGSVPSPMEGLSTLLVFFCLFFLFCIFSFSFFLFLVLYLFSSSFLNFYSRCCCFYLSIIPFPLKFEWIVIIVIIYTRNDDKRIDHRKLLSVFLNLAAFEKNVKSINEVRVTIFFIKCISRVHWFKRGETRSRDCVQLENPKFLFKIISSCVYNKALLFNHLRIPGACKGS